MESLPDDVCLQIVQFGTAAGLLDHIDLCSLAIVNSLFDQLTQESSLWATLLSRDFPSALEFSQAPSKDLYRELLHEEKREIESLIKLRVGTLNKLIESNIRIIERAFQSLHYTASLFLASDQLHETAYVSSSQSNYFSLWPTQVNSQPQLNFVNPTMGRDLDVLASQEEGAPALSYDNHPSLRQEHNHYYEKKRSKRFDKSSRPKAVPMSKSYIPINRPPRRSMPRKI